MMDKQTFTNTLAFSLKNAGLAKKGKQSWYLHGKDAIIVVNLQKSRWDDLYYINIGIWLKRFGETVYPLHNHCHLCYRAESLFPEQRELIIKSCSLDKSSSEELSKLSAFIEEEFVPFLQNCTNESKLKELFSQEYLNNGLVDSEARNYLTHQN